MQNAMRALSVALKTTRDKRRSLTVSAVIATLGVTVGLLVLALWSWSGGVAPIHGQNVTFDEIQVRAPDLTRAPGAATSPLNAGQSGDALSLPQTGGGPSLVRAQVVREVGSGIGYRAIVAGGSYTCGILTSGSLRCWGLDSHGPVREAPQGGSFVSVAPGSNHACAIRQDGTVDCWGSDWSGLSTPPDGIFAGVGAGWVHSCGIRDNGRIVCWGSSEYGATDAPSGTFASLSVGGNHNCAIRTDGAVVCWGANHFGQATPPEGAFRSVTAGVYHSCGLLMNGSLVCWGNNWYGRINETPGEIFHAVSANHSDTCGLREDGTIVCWGQNEFGQSSPVEGKFRSISVGYRHTCALRTDGLAVCWGDNRDGQLDFPGEPPATTEGHRSDSGAGYRAIATGLEHTCGISFTGELRCWGGLGAAKTPPPQGVFQSVAPGAHHSCALRQNGTITCWGSNEMGQSEPPDGTFTAVESGREHSCAIRHDGTIACWGDDDFGETGDAPSGYVKALGVGVDHNCAVRLDGTVVCWGRNDAGQSISPEGDFQSVAAGYDHSCGILTSGLATCWGSNAQGKSNAPSGVFKSITAGYGNTCGLREDDAIICWGSNEFGQSNSVDGKFRSVSTRYGHTCGLRFDGVAVCWGQVSHGRMDFPVEPPAPPVSGISVCNGPDEGEVVISWDAVLQATHYRIGYVNTVEDLPRATASVTGEWTEAFIYVDVNALNIPVSSDGRAQYTLRRLAQGDPHAFSVLTSNSVTNTKEMVRGSYAWPQNPSWHFLTVGDPEAGCGSATAAGPPTVPTPTAPSSSLPGDYDADDDGLVEIADLVQLDAVRYDLDGDGSSSNRLYADAFPEPLTGMGCPSSGCVGYELTNDLDFNLSDASAYWRDSRGWTPIGDAGEESGFDAIFDGNGYTIRNLSINWPATDYVGIFRTTTANSVVRNLSLGSVSITGSSHVGALVGLNRGSITNVSVSGNVAANANNAGGLTGANHGNITASSASARVSAQGNGAGGLSGTTGQVITGSFASGQVTSEMDQAGGLVGLANNATIMGSYATGSVSAKNRVGGLIGEANSTTLTGVYATGSATGNYTTYYNRGKRLQSRDGQFVGGLIGHATQTSVTSSYATTTVKGAEQVAGLIGSAEDGSIRNIYAVGNIWYPTSTAWDGLKGNGGGLVGTQERLAIQDSYWDTQSTGQSGSAAGMGKTTVELQTPTANTGLYASWDANRWDFGTPRQYPALKYDGLDVDRQRR